VQRAQDYQATLATPQATHEHHHLTDEAASMHTGTHRRAQSRPGTRAYRAQGTLETLKKTLHLLSCSLNLYTHCTHLGESRCQRSAAARMTGDGESEVKSRVPDFLSFTPCMHACHLHHTMHAWGGCTGNTGSMHAWNDLEEIWTKS
jgi:hypothetical protein